MEVAGGIAAVDDDGLGIGFGEEENAQAGEGEVGFGFFVEVGAARGFAEDFKDDDRVFLIVEERVGGLADDHGVGVVKADVVAEGDADFGVAVAGVAEFAAELGIKTAEKICGNRIVSVGAFGPWKRMTGDKLVFVFCEFLGFEIFLFSEESRHGRWAGMSCGGIDEVSGVSIFYGRDGRAPFFWAFFTGGGFRGRGRGVGRFRGWRWIG